MEATITRTRCTRCNGKGEVPTGHANLIGLPTFTTCDDCLGYGETYHSGLFDDMGDEPGETPAPVTVGGFTVEAPGFTPDSFDRAIQRAFNDNLDLGAIPGAIGRFRVNGYTTDRHTCTCKAGQAGMGCKHRAYVIYQMDIAGTAWAEAA